MHVTAIAKRPTTEPIKVGIFELNLKPMKGETFAGEEWRTTIACRCKVTSSEFECEPNRDEQLDSCEQR